MFKRVGYSARGLLYTFFFASAVKLFIWADEGAGPGERGDRLDGPGARLARRDGCWWRRRPGRHRRRAVHRLAGRAASSASGSRATRWAGRAAVDPAAGHGRQHRPHDRLLMIGVFLIVAAAQADPHAGGRHRRGPQAPGRPALTGPSCWSLVALGLAAYGLYSFAEARYRRLPAMSAGSERPPRRRRPGPTERLARCLGRAADRSRLWWLVAAVLGVSGGRFRRRAALRGLLSAGHGVGAGQRAGQAGRRRRRRPDPGPATASRASAGRHVVVPVRPTPRPPSPSPRASPRSCPLAAPPVAALAGLVVVLPGPQRASTTPPTSLGGAVLGVGRRPRHPPALAGGAPRAGRGRAPP